jgi:hypothetical protein
MSLTSFEANFFRESMTRFEFDNLTRLELDLVVVSINLDGAL